MTARLPAHFTCDGCGAEGSGSAGVVGPGRVLPDELPPGWKALPNVPGGHICAKCDVKERNREQARPHP